MAIASVNDIVNNRIPYGEDCIKAAFTGEAAGQIHSGFYLAGRPGAAVAPTPGINGAALTSYAGSIPIPGAVGGESIYLSRLSLNQAANIGGAIVCDRLWHNSGITVTTTTAQSITPVAIPARSAGGGTTGLGVLPALEVSTATTNASAVTTITISYTNEAGTAGRTGTIASFPATAVAGTFVPFTLQAGDLGCRSIQSITLGTSLVTGTVHLVLYREIADIGSPVNNVTNVLGPLDLGLPIIYDSSVLFVLFNLVGTAAGITNIQLNYTQG